MSMFIEVYSLDKNCEVIINLDTIVEIAPLREGGCNIFYTDAAAVGGKTAMKVRDSYAMFKQFVLQTVSEDDIKRRVSQFNMIEKQENPAINRLPEQKRGPGRPPKNADVQSQEQSIDSESQTGMVTSSALS